MVKKRPPPKAAKLSEREKRFARLYAATQNATRAYLQAGYDCTPASASVNRLRLLRKARVKQLVERLQLGRLEQLELGIVEAWQVIARVVRFDPRQLYNERGELLPIRQWPDDVAMVVTEVHKKAHGTRVGFPDKLRAAMRILEAKGVLSKHVAVQSDLAALLAAGATDADRKAAGVDDEDA